MSDMRHYIGTYQYLGEFKTNENGTSELNVQEFTYYGRHYKPSTPLKFVVHPEEEGYILIACEKLDIRILGVGLEEALGNAIMAAALLYNDLVFTAITLDGKTEEFRDKVLDDWKVFDVDSKAQ